MKTQCWGRVFMSGVQETFLTQRMQPHGHVIHVWVVWVVEGGGKGCGKHPRHKEHDHMVAFFVSGW